MLRSFFFIVVLATSVLSSFAQNGTIAGTVSDANNGESVVGANVIIQGTSVGTSTDIDGKFAINNLKPGNYNLTITFITYKAHTVPNVEVVSGKITALQVQMHEDVSELQEVVITGTREINNDISLMSAIKESKLVVSGVSAEQIVKLPDNDAAQVMKRVPGITIVDNRFVMVRGVPERYNQVMINQAIAPSTEVDKRSFSFDLVPSAAVDQLLIYKSGSADLPGDFGGGVIQVVTRQTPDEEYFTVGLGFGYRDNITFQDFVSAKRSSSDFLGFDNGKRALPSGFPSSDALKQSETYGSVRENAGKSLDNNFGIHTATAPADYSFNFGFAKRFEFGSVRLSNLSSVNYSRSWQFSNTGYTRYGEFDTDPETKSQTIYDFKDNVYQSESKVSLVHNWQALINSRSKIEFKNLFVQLGEDRTTLRTGTDITSIPGLYANNAYHFMSRSIYTGQIQGEFKSIDEQNIYRVMFGLNHVARNEPDFRRFRTIYDDNTGSYRMILPPSANLFDAGRFYSDLSDNGYSHGLNFEKHFGQEKGGANVKAGYYTEYKTRQFNARYVSYLYPSNFDGPYGDQLAHLPIGQIFAQPNMFSRNAEGTLKPGFAIQEGTRPTDSYSGKNMLLAAYVSSTLPIGAFDITAGFRIEHNDQQLTSFLGDSVITKNVTSPLPSVNVAYNLSDRSLIRMAYSKTVNRPEFRELAPFLFYQFEYNLNIQGNKNLKTASIDNVDLRYELYPNPGEIFSVGGFFKHIQNPIEFVQQNASGNLQFGYQNAPQAYVYGAEVELRKSLASLGVSKLLRNTSVNVNASVIKSQVDMGEGVIFQERFRPLQGQSPYVINAGAYYNDPDLGWSANVGYNIFGNRIFSVGSILFPTWIERPRNACDVQVGKKFGNLEAKLTVHNVFNAQYRLYQDNDENQKIDESVDDPIQLYKVGRLFSLSLSWKIMKQ